MEQSTNPINPPVKNPDTYKALLEIQSQEASLKVRRGYLKAYMLSFFLPPLGLYYFFKYLFFADTNYENRKAAFICLTITIFLLLINIWLFNLLFGQASPQSQRNEEFIKELITPQNQQELKKLLQ